jgi:hypothetical protein
MLFCSFAQLLQDQVHEIGYAKCSKFYVFRGGKEYTEADPGHARLSAQNRAALGPANLCPRKRLALLVSFFPSPNASSNSRVSLSQSRLMTRGER